MVSTKEYLFAGKCRFSILQKVQSFKWEVFWRNQDLRIPNFGFSLFLAWNSVFFFSSVITKFYSSPTTATSALRVSSGMSTVATYLAIILLSRYMGPLYRKRNWGMALSSLAGIGTFLVFAAPLLPYDYPLTILGGVFTGLGTAWTVACWGEFISTLPPRQITVCVFCSFFFGAILYFPIVALPSVTSAITVALLVPISWRLSSLSIDSANPLPVAIKTSKTLFRRNSWRILLTFFVFSTSFWIFVEASSRLESFSATDTFSLAILISAILIAIICAIAAVLRRFISLTAIHRIALPLSTTGLVIIFMLDPINTDLGFALAMSAITCLDAFLTITLCATSHETGYPPAKALSIGHCIEGLCVPLGVLIGDATLPIIESGEVAIILIVVCVLVLTTSLASGSNQTTANESTDDVRETAASTAEHFAQQCNRAIEQFGLSQRESEILLLITRGRSIPYIAQRLHIANSTAKTHIHSMYKKMNTVDRQGMIDLIESLEVDDKEPLNSSLQ